MVIGEIPRSNQSTSRGKRGLRAYEREQRTAACLEFAVETTRYTSINDFVFKKRRKEGIISEWKPSKGQMIRDMKKIFGPNRPSKRGAKRVTSKLTIPENVNTILQSSGSQLFYRELRIMERNIIKGLKSFETEFGLGAMRPNLIASIASMEIIQCLPKDHDCA